MNEVLKAIKERRSIRKFKPDMPERKDIDAVIEAGLYAASGKGTQSPIIIAVTNKELRDKISRDNCKIGGWNEDFATSRIKISPALLETGGFAFVRLEELGGC